MAISIIDHMLPDDTHNLYDVKVFTDEIHTLVTHTPSMVDSWISSITQAHPPVVGLDIEWRPNTNRHIENPVATLQLCTGPRCLVFQIKHAPSIPQTLVSFLKNESITFVGVGINEDVEKLLLDYELGVAKTVDLRALAAQRMGERSLENAGMKQLAKVVLGKEIKKPKRVTMSRWDNEWLTADQVQYACVDAFVCFEIGRVLNANDKVD